ncbi:MAG: alpha/beta hydrolase [Desulfobacterales bacterium]
MTRYKTKKIDNLDIFYRESGSSDNQTILLLHGFPTSSHMYRNLIPKLAQNYHVIAPDYPGFGHSDMPPHDQFAYTFDNYSKLVDQLLDQLGVKRFVLYVFDYGAPVGFRLFSKYPDRVAAIISQNDNAYDDGIAGFWDSIKAYWESGANQDREAIRWLTTTKATKWQYENGVPADRLQYLSPNGWQHDQSLLDRSGNTEIQLDIFYDYRTNIPLYPLWQKAFRQHKPPMLSAWGKNDEIFVAPGAETFKRDLPDAEIHLLNTGHFALETHGDEIAALIKNFLAKHFN